MNHQILLKLKDLYNNNINITNYLRNELNQAANNSDIIEIAYDLQSGTYIKNAEQNSEKLIEIQNEYYNLIQPHISEGDSILDIGTGELTTLTGLVNLIELNNIEIYAFDISWSRIYKGLEYYNSKVKKNYNLNAFVCDIRQIALPTKSIDITISSHALEPNGGNLKMLLKEIFRVSRKCILFEPSYEINSKEGKERMDKLFRAQAASELECF